jgi:uncharacterized protein YdaU (DUF1376 family)
MHYYQFNIGDYRSATAHLSNEEDLAYRRLLDMYYDTEQKIPIDTQWVARRIRVEPVVVRDVLNDMFVQHEDGWFHARCADVIEQYHAMAEKNRANGRLGGRKKNPVGSDSHPNAKATINDKPITINQEPLVKKQRGTRLPQDFVFPKEWAEFCHEQRSDLNIQKTFDSFKDYWVSKPGAGGVKLDWFATWRNWVRNQSAPKGLTTFAQVKADVARTTVPENRDYEATQRRLAAEASIQRSGPSKEVLAKMAAIRKSAEQSQ